MGVAVASRSMSALARTTEINCDTRAANEDCINGGSRTRTKYGYDSKTRPSTQTITIPGDATYTYTNTYSATTGLLATLQYPVSTSSYQMTLQYAYQNGILQEISDATTGAHYWLADTTNPRGQLTQETLGNGLVVNHAFDAVTGWVGSVQAGVGGGATLQNNSYLFDEVGDLIERQDNNQGLTENIYYDNLYRLSSTSLNGTTNATTTYDVTGNVLTWSFAGDGGTPITLNYTSPQPGCTYFTNAQPHAVRIMTQGTTTVPICYDANGNVLSFGGVETMGWTTFNQPDSIALSPAASSSQFFYNANHQRYKQIASFEGTTETTIYAGNLMEKVISATGTAYRHYIPAGSNTALYIRWSTGSNPTYYITKDHFGSSSVVTDSTGALVVEESFAAWGFRRGSDWTSDGPTGAQMAIFGSTTRHGFTGQEMLDNLDMVNMNGRIYGANQFPRMLSPDPNIPDPGNTQSYNRYSYVNNNPLTMVDPSGFVPGGICSGLGYCPSDIDHAGSGGVGSLSDGSFGGFTGTATDVDDELFGPSDTGALTDWFNSAASATSGALSGAISSAIANGTIGVPMAGDATASGMTTQPGGSVQSGAPISMAPSDDGFAPIVVNATPISGAPPGGFTDYQPFPCGGSTCLAEMGTWNSLVWGQQGVHLGVSNVPAGSAWVQTYVRTTGVNAGQFQEDIDPGASSPVYTGYGATPSYFTDSPGAVLGTTGAWVAQTSLVQPNGAGGYSAVFTFQWGFSYSPAGVQYIWPVAVMPGNFQQQTIGSMH